MHALMYMYTVVCPHISKLRCPAQIEKYNLFFQKKLGPMRRLDTDSQS